MLTPSPTRNRRAFTLAEVIVAFTLIAVLAAVLIPTVAGRLQDGYEDAIVQEFSNIATAVTAYRQDVGKYPPKLSYLTALPGTPKDKCNNNLSPTAIAAWHGPYINRFIPAVAGTGVAYLFAQKDTMNDTLITTTSPNGFFVRLLGPDSRTAIDVDVRIDGSNNATAGSIQWTGASRTDVILSYVIPSKSGAC